MWPCLSRMNPDPCPCCGHGAVEEVVRDLGGGDVHHAGQRLLVDGDVLLLFGVKGRRGGGLGQREVPQRPVDRRLGRACDLRHAAMQQAGQRSHRHQPRGDVVKSTEDQEDQQYRTQFHLHWTGTFAGAEAHFTDFRRDAWIGPTSRFRDVGAELLAALHLQQPPLALGPPAIAGQPAIGPHHAMAGHHDSQQIGAACRADGAHRLRRTHGLRDLRIRPRLSARNRQQRPPNPLLEGRRAHVEGKRSGSRILAQPSPAQSSPPRRGPYRRAAAPPAETARAAPPRPPHRSPQTARRTVRARSSPPARAPAVTPSRHSESSRPRRRPSSPSGSCPASRPHPHTTGSTNRTPPRTPHP